MIDTKDGVIILTREEYERLKFPPQQCTLYGVHFETWNELAAIIKNRTNMSIRDFVESVKRNERVFKI